MKKITYLILALSFGYSSCDSNVPIVGEWQLVSMKSNGISIHYSCDLESYLTFSENNSGIYFQYESNNVQTEPCVLDGTDELTWTKGTTSSTYNLSVFDESFIAVLSGNTMKLTATDSDTEVLEFSKK